MYEFAASGEVAFAEGVAHERVADRRAADEAFGRAAVYFAIAGYPHLRGRHARAALARAYESYARAGDDADVPLEIWEMQLGDVSFPAFVHLPAGVGPFAVVLKTGGMDVPGIEFRPLAQALNDRGIAMIAFDMPGTGNDGIVDADAQAHHEAVLDRVVGDPRFDPQRIAVWSESLGGIPAVKVAIERRDQLAAVVNGCGVLHALHVFEVAGPEEAASYAKAIEAYDAGDLNRLEIAAIELRIKADPQFRALQSSFQFPVYVDRVRAQPGSLLDLGSRARRISLKHQGLIGGTVRTPVPLLTINTQADPYVPVSDSVMATQASRRGTLALFGDHDGHCLARSLEIPAVLAWLDPILGDAARSR